MENLVWIHVVVSMNKKYLIQYIEDYLEGEHYKYEALYLGKDDYEMILEALKESINDR